VPGGLLASEVQVSGIRNVVVVLHRGLECGALLGGVLVVSLVEDPELLHLHLPVDFGVVSKVTLEHDLLEPRQVAGVNGDTVVFLGTALSDKGPVAVLLLEIKTSGVGDKDEREEPARETEPADKPKLGVVADVVVNDGGQESTDFARSGGETMCGGTDGDGVHLGSDEEGGAVGAELLEERREEVEGLETRNVFRGLELVEPDGTNEEDDTVTQEPDNLHPLATVELVVDEERGHVVTGERDTDIYQVPKPAIHEVGSSVGRYDLDEGGSEQLVAVEKEIIEEPPAAGTDHAATKVVEDELEIGDVVTGDVGASLSVG